MNVDEAIESLKSSDPRLIVMLAELCASVRLAKAANNRESAQRRMAEAIVTLLKATGADDELLSDQIEEAHEATASTGLRVTRADLDHADLQFSDGGVAFIQAAFARLLVSLPIGIAGTAAGLAAIGSLKASKGGYENWLYERAKRPGGDTSVEAGIERLVVEAVLAEAARLVVQSALSRSKAIVKAVALHGAKAMDNGIKLNPELLRVRSSRKANGDKPADPLHVFFEDRLQYERDLKSGRPRPRPKVV